MSLETKIADTLAQIATALEREHDVARAVLQVTQNANRLRGNRPVPIGTGGRILAWAGPGRLLGWTLAADAADATIVFRDSHDTAGDPVAGPIIVPGGTSITFALPAAGVGFGDGLFVDADAAFTGVAWIGADS